MKENRSIVILIFVLILIIGGCQKKNTVVSILSVEEKALNFFADSLYKADSLFFNFEDSLVRFPGTLGEDMYHEGLFWGWNIVTDAVLDKVSEPYTDTLTHIVHPDAINKEEQQIILNLHSSYNRKMSKPIEYTKISIPNKVQTSTLQDFDKSGQTKDLFLKVNHFIKSGDLKYVELVFRNYLDYSKYDEYSLYVIFDSSDQINGWFIM